MKMIMKKRRLNQLKLEIDGSTDVMLEIGEILWSIFLNAHSLLQRKKLNIYFFYSWGIGLGIISSNFFVKL